MARVVTVTTPHGTKHTYTNWRVREQNGELRLTGPGGTVAVYPAGSWEPPILIEEVSDDDE